MSFTIMLMLFTEVFNRQRLLESRGRLEDEGTKTTTTHQVLNIIQKVPETFIYLQVDEEFK